MAGAVLVFAALAWSPWIGGLRAAPLDRPSAVGAVDGLVAPAGVDPPERPAPSARRSESSRVVVGEDDTIWDLARTHAPAGTHPTVYARAVTEANDVDPLRLRPGEVLWLPPG